MANAKNATLNYIFVNLATLHQLQQFSNVWHLPELLFSSVLHVEQLLATLFTFFERTSQEVRKVTQTETFKPAVTGLFPWQEKEQAGGWWEHCDICPSK